MADPIEKKIETDQGIIPEDTIEANLENEDDNIAGRDGVLPKGSIDPVYEAKARVLNNAVGIAEVGSSAQLMRSRFKRLVWDDTIGNCSLLLDSDGPTITSGLL